MVCNAGVFTPEFQETDVIVAEKKICHLMQV
jgi:hypothetical protein